MAGVVGKELVVGDQIFRIKLFPLGNAGWEARTMGRLYARGDTADGALHALQQRIQDQVATAPGRSDYNHRRFLPR